MMGTLTRSDFEHCEVGVFLAVRPGGDAWLLDAMLAILVQDNRIDCDWLDANSQGLEEILPHFAVLPITHYCEAAGVPEAQVRETTDRIARASSTAFFEYLGVKMNRHSTLVSYLHKLLVFCTGNFGKKGAAYSPASIVPIGTGSESNQLTPVPSRGSPRDLT